MINQKEREERKAPLVAQFVGAATGRNQCYAAEFRVGCLFPVNEGCWKSLTLGIDASWYPHGKFIDALRLFLRCRRSTYGILPHCFYISLFHLTCGTRVIVLKWNAFFEGMGNPHYI